MIIYYLYISQIRYKIIKSPQPFKIDLMIIVGYNTMVFAYFIYVLKLLYSIIFSGLSISSCGLTLY